MEKVLIICGPTATGKTSLGLRLAEKYRGEIISADSRQVYRGMDIGTGKDLPVNSNFKIQVSKINLKNKNLNIGFYRIDRVKVWLYDLVDPDFSFSVAEYLTAAEKVISYIWRRGKMPIVISGTGFYLKGLTEGIETVGVKPDWKLRKRLQSYKVSELRGLLKAICPERMRRMNESDRQNPRRLIRAIEIITSTKYKVQSTKEKKKVGRNTPEAWEGLRCGGEKFNTLFIGLTAPQEFLYQRIDQRVGERVDQGIEDEIETLLKQGYSWNNSVLASTIGYKEWQPLMSRTKNKEQRTKEEVIKRWKLDEHAYARRQLTWFRKQKEIKWFNIAERNWQKEVEDLVGPWYNQSN